MFTKCHSENTLSNLNAEVIIIKLSNSWPSSHFYPFRYESLWLNITVKWGVWNLRGRNISMGPVSSPLLSKILMNNTQMPVCDNPWSSRHNNLTFSQSQVALSDMCLIFLPEKNELQKDCVVTPESH